MSDVDVKEPSFLDFRNALMTELSTHTCHRALLVACMRAVVKIAPGLRREKSTFLFLEDIRNNDFLGSIPLSRLKGISRSKLLKMPNFGHIKVNILEKVLAQFDIKLEV